MRLHLSTTRALQLFQLMRQGSIFLTSIVLAKSGLGMEGIGAYEVLLYIGTAVTFFWVSGLLQAMTPVHGRLHPADRGAFLFNVFLVFCGISAALCGLLLLTENWVVPLLTGLPQVPYFGLFCAYLFFYLPAFQVEYIYLLRKKARQVLAWGLVSFGLHVAAVGLPLCMGGGLRESLLALTGLNAVRWLWTAGLVGRIKRVSLRLDLIRQYLVFSLPLTAGVLVGNVILLFDNWLVGWYYRDEAVFAMFRYGAREFPLALALATALGVSIIPRLSEDLAGGLADLKAMTRRLFHLLFPLTIVLLLFSRWLFPLVFNPGFAASAPIFNIFLLLTASRVLLPNSVVLAIGSPRVILYISLVELAVKVTLGFLFIRWWGLAGVAWSAVAAYWTEKIGLVWYLERYYGVRTAQWLDWRTYGCWVAALMAAYVLISV